MSMLFRCPQCGHRVQATEKAAGQVTNCTKCGSVFRFPLEFPRAAPRRPSKKEVAEENVRDGQLSRPGNKIDMEELIDMTAMVDIVFFLLIFFLVTSMSAIQSSAPLPRPETHSDEAGGKAKQSTESQNDPNAIIVKIGKDDSIEIDGVPYREIADLTARLHQLKTATGPDMSVLVVGHSEASHGAAVAVLDAGYEVGINHLRLAVLDDGSTDF